MGKATLGIATFLRYRVKVGLEIAMGKATLGIATFLNR